MTKSKRFRWPKFEMPKLTETRLVNAVFTVSPWLTPIITAWLVFDATQKYLFWWPPKSFVAALIIEMCGISYTNLVMYLYREKADKILIQISAGIVGVYVLTILCLTIVLEMFPQAASLAPALFVLLVTSSSMTVAVRSHHKAVKASGKIRKVTESSKKDSETFPKDSRKFQPDHWRWLGGAEVNEIVERVGVCEKTATKYYNMARNGHRVTE